MEQSEFAAPQVPHLCPKCSGTGWLRYNPAMPFTSRSAGPWHCNACVNGIIWVQGQLFRNAKTE